MTSTIAVSTASELMSALAGATGGETILLAAGNYGDLNLWNVRQPFAKFASEVTIKSANSSDPAVFNHMSLEGVENLTLDGVKLDYNAVSGASDWEIPFKIGGPNHITIRNSTFDGDIAQNVSSSADGYGTGKGLIVSSSSDVTVENNDFHTWMRATIDILTNSLFAITMSRTFALTVSTSPRLTT